MKTVYESLKADDQSNLVNKKSAIRKTLKHSAGA
jgi:hypothetical protein